MQTFKQYLKEKVDKNSPIYKEYLQLKKLSIKSLRDILGRNQKVVDLKGYDKEGAISQILRDKHGNKKVDKVFNEGYNMYAEDTLKEAAYYIDISPWSYANAGKKPRGKGMWAFEYKVSVDSGGMVGLQQDRFFSKAMSTYKDAVKQLTNFLKKEFKAKPKDVKIKLAP
jgi:hypothetical protein